MMKIIILKSITLCLLIFHPYFEIKSYAQLDTFLLKINSGHFTNYYKYEIISNSIKILDCINVLKSDEIISISKNAEGNFYLEDIDTGVIELQSEMSFNYDSVISDEKLIKNILRTSYDDFILEDTFFIEIDEIEFGLYAGIDSIINIQSGILTTDSKSIRQLNKKISKNILDFGGFLSLLITLKTPHLDSNAIYFIVQEYKLIPHNYHVR